jgi:16S rRNA processing protein RimM
LNASLPESPQLDAPGAPAPGPEAWVLVARVVRPQGRHGEVLADLLTDFPERFAERKRLFLQGPKSAPRPVELEKHWLHQRRVVLKFVGIDSIDDAETLRGLEVCIPRAERAPLEDGAVYISDLIGCLLVDSRTQGEVGKIAGVDREASATPMLVIETPPGEVLVPFAKAFAPRIDLAAKRIEMQLPEGLLDLNVPSGKD